MVCFKPASDAIYYNQSYISYCTHTKNDLLIDDLGLTSVFNISLTNQDQIKLCI